MMDSPLALGVIFRVGPVAVTTPVVATWGIMLLLAGGSWLLTRRLSLHPSRRQAALEVVVEAIEAQIRDTMRVDPAPYVPLIGSCSCSSSPPTGRPWCRAWNHPRRIWKPTPRWR
jgi:F-type H+-transporting ATPase subunit a